MDRPIPVLEGAGVVLVGSFNPAILQPAWLGARELVTKDEESSFVTQVISREVTILQLPWLLIQVTPERFEITSEDPAHYLALRDLVKGIFLILDSTPFNQMGITRWMHCAVESEQRWHALGDALAPKGPWQGLLESTRPDKLPGMASLTILGTRESARSRATRATVEPSARVKNGLFFRTHEHFEEEVGGTEIANRLLGY